ncbi:Histone-lysine N-methyltransferase SETMAR [Eumeta japonica]|uniref:Histone-lysine N-methyltransferase SETMAR n=1 Tax=Eumeta variegata TaxID=151549 RepID=A0A4C1YGZ3_EUMVA|nr:Histone-lysine N-methyltransferase SETMAR [Eumeta japonica]
MSPARARARARPAPFTCAISKIEWPRALTYAHARAPRRVAGRARARPHPRMPADFITYDKKVRKRSWSKGKEAPQTIAKPGLTRDKLMPCVWWDWKGIIHYELLPPGKTIISDLYCQQLMRLKQEVEQKRPE